MSGDLEARLLASLPSIEAFESLGEQGIGPASFSHWRPMYDYIDQVVRDNQHLPRLVDLKATFNLPDHIRREPHEYDWLLQEFRRLTLAQQVQGLLDRVIETYGEQPEELVPQLVRELTALGGTRGQQSASTTDARSSARMEGYAALAEGQSEGFMHGIPTGYSYFDAKARLGWLPGELIGIVARPYVGKSWLLVWHGALAWQAGYRVLMLSPEMVVEEAEARFDAVLAGLRGVPVSVTELYRGFRPSAALHALAAEVSKRGDWVTLDTAGGRPFKLGQIPRLIATHRPDLLLVDGLPLVGAEGGRGQALWEQIKDLSYGLKDIAVGAHIPIIVTHQATRGAHDTKKPPGLHEIAFGDAFGQACDKVLVLSRTMEEERRRMTIQKFRKGAPMQGGVELIFDPEHGKIREAVDDDEDLPTGANGTRGRRSSRQAGPRAQDEVLIP